MLTDRTLKGAKPREKPYKLADEKGLYLLVHPTGGRWWRLKYRFDGKEQLLSLGVYPDVPLKRARKKRDEARDRIDQGINPSLHRQLERAQRKESAANSFEAVALEWLAKQKPAWKPVHFDRIKRRLEVDVFPRIGPRPIAEVKAPEILAAIRRIASRGAVETAHRALSECSQVFRYAIACGKVESDPCRDLRSALPSAESKHLAAITEPKAAGELMRAIRGYRGSPVTAAALKLAPLVFVRPGELRQAEWTEFDLEQRPTWIEENHIGTRTIPAHWEGGPEWRIPAVKMKGTKAEKQRKENEHIVPLSEQALAILRDVQQITGQGRYVFPSVRTEKRPMSENTVLAALRRLGYTTEQMTGHGVRAMARTLLREKLGWDADVIERQLAHGSSEELGSAYDRTQFLPERQKMMQQWADYLDKLASETTNVVAGSFGRAA